MRSDPSRGELKQLKRELRELCDHGLTIRSGNRFCGTSWSKETTGVSGHNQDDIDG